MEDNGRELDPDPIKTPPVKDRYPSKKELTIMLIGSVGKMRSFKISRKLIMFTSIFFLIYIVFSLFIFYQYIDLYFIHKTQSEDMQNLVAELSDKTKDLERKKLLIKVLEDSWKGVDEKSETKTAKEGPPKKNPPKINVSSKKKSQETAQKELEKKAENMGATIKETSELSKPEVTPVKTEEPTPVLNESVEGSMEVKNIEFQRTDSELTLNFKLTNKLAEQKTAEGYIHIIVMNKNKECLSEWNNSYNRLSNGFPVTYNHGQEFIIQNFRPYQRKYKTNPDSELPAFIRIIVYDRSGQKILEKEFPVTDESSNDPT